mgnify:FL=1
MFPDKVTVFNIVDDKYNRQVIDDVFAHTEKIISKEGNGEKYSTAHRVIFSNKALEKYLSYVDYTALNDKSNNFTLKENDLIIFGEFKEITDLSEVQKSHVDYFLIKSISDNTYAINILNNIEVTD